MFKNYSFSSPKINRFQDAQRRQSLELFESTATQKSMFSFVNSNPAKSKHRKSLPSYFEKRGKLAFTEWAERTFTATSSIFSLKTAAFGSTPATSGAVQQTSDSVSGGGRLRVLAEVIGSSDLSSQRWLIVFRLTKKAAAMMSSESSTEPRLK